MYRREAKELTATSARFPLGDFLAILKTRIENVNRTTKNTGTPKVIATGPSAAEELDRSEAVEFGGVVV
jgi:hypothetical protein